MGTLPWGAATQTLGNSGHVRLLRRMHSRATKALLSAAEKGRRVEIVPPRFATGVAAETCENSWRHSEGGAGLLALK